MSEIAWIISHLLNGKSVKIQRPTNDGCRMKHLVSHQVVFYFGFQTCQVGVHSEDNKKVLNRYAAAATMPASATRCSQERAMNIPDRR
jgi:hypothetical protein